MAETVLFGDHGTCRISFCGEPPTSMLRLTPYQATYFAYCQQHAHEKCAHRPDRLDTLRPLVRDPEGWDD